MKRTMFVLVAGMIAVALGGCNRAWPSLFCNNNSCYDDVVYEECDPCATGYAPATAGEWIVAPGSTMSDALPGPAVSKSNAG